MLTMPKSKAIVVIDMVKGFLEPGHPLYCGEEARGIIPCVIQLLSSHKENPIFYICDSHAPDDREFRMFPPHCVTGTEEVELIEELKPYPGMIIPKTSFSGFYKTDFEQELKRIHPETVTVVGVCTDICVLYTVADLRARHYEVEVPASCVASFDPKGHEWALRHMEKVLGAKVIKE
jgi:nicotinamidase/pyrazinamidase